MNTYDCKVVYDTAEKKAKSQFVVEAETVADAETRLAKELSPYLAGEMAVKRVIQASYGHIDTDRAGDFWYKAKIQYLIVQENGKEKTSSEDILVIASDMHGAVSRVGEIFANSMLQWELISIQKTQIEDIYRWTD